MEQDTHSCTSVDVCTNSWQVLRKNAYERHILSSYRLLDKKVALRTKFCDNCAALIQSKGVEMRREIWLKLPSHMGIALENWQV